MNEPVFVSNRSLWHLIKMIGIGLLLFALSFRAFFLFLEPGSYSSSRFGMIATLMRFGSDFPIVALALSVLLLGLGLFILWGSIAGLFPLKIYKSYVELWGGFANKRIEFGDITRVYNRVPGSGGLFIAHTDQNGASTDTWIPVSYFKETPEEIEKVLQDNLLAWRSAAG